MTRARIAVIVIGKNKSLNNDPYWKRQVSYCKNELDHITNAPTWRPKKEKKATAQESAVKNASENQEEKESIAKCNKNNESKVKNTKTLKQ